MVVVDVLSFTTAVTVAVEAGTRVFPYPRQDETAAAFAEQVEAALAVGRKAATPTAPWSLSAAALRRAPATPRLVLPSPNGSAISATVQTRVVAGCLRNAAATGRWLAEQGLGTRERPVAVVAAGERWPDESLRPTLEDLLAAGAIIAEARMYGSGPPSPEAEAAAACFAAVPDVTSAVAACASGVELRQMGFAEDVAIATELDACDVVPVKAPNRPYFTAADHHRP
ncbi:MAG: hypothetical protein GEV03_24920 [Streptosporangiales bacterium]|nr:hypothetical protein [Streptosporangiales bacterium]